MVAVCEVFFSGIFFITTIKTPKNMERDIYYSDKYYDNEYEYRHVVLPKEMVKHVPKTHLMSEEEWRRIGVQQSKGWQHYMTHAPEPHILLFKRPITTPPTSQNRN